MITDTTAIDLIARILWDPSDLRRLWTSTEIELVAAAVKAVRPDADKPAPVTSHRPYRDLELPPGLSADGLLAYSIVRNVIADHDLTFTGGCRIFYSPTQWAARGEAYGRDAELIVVYDGAAVREAFDPSVDDGGDAFVNLTERLEARGLVMQPCTHWYSAIRKVA